MISDLFLKIIDRKIPAKIEYEDDEIICIHDIAPQAPVHLLIVPKRHIAGVADLGHNDADRNLVGQMILTANKIAQDKGWSDYRLVFNNGEDAGQTVGHIHLHLLAGRKFTWPPG